MATPYLRAKAPRGLRTASAFLLSSLLLLMTFPSAQVGAQGPATQNSVPISFRDSFPVAQGTQPLASYSGTGVNLQYSAALTYGEDLVLTTESSIKYAQAGTSGALTMSESNDIALLELSGNATVTFSFLGTTTGSLNYPISIEYAVPVTAGSQQSVVLGTFSVANAQVGPVNVQVNMQPTVAWTPLISGTYAVQGPATVNPSTMSLSGNPATATISFSDNQPTDLFLDNPQLVLQSMSLLLHFPVLIGGLQVADPSVPIVNAGTYLTYASTSRLISYDPNYYPLYTQLQNSLSGLSTTVQQLQNSYNTLSSDFQQLQTSFNTISSRVDALSNSLSNLSSSFASLKAAESSLSATQLKVQQSLGNLSSSFNHSVAIIRSEIISLGSSLGGTSNATGIQSSPSLAENILTIIGLILETIGAVIIGLSDVMNEEKAKELAAPHYDWSPPVMKELLRRSRNSKYGLAFVIVGSLFLVVPSLLPLFGGS